MSNEDVSVSPVRPYKIESIYLKKDGSYLVTLDSYPFHATEAETPEVYRAVRSLIESGDECQAYVEPVFSDTQVRANERVWRDAQIQRVSWLRDRHRDQLDIGLKTTLSAEQFKVLLDYIQALRDWPQADSFPAPAKRPVAMPWLEGIAL